MAIDRLIPAVARVAAASVIVATATLAGGCSDSPRVSPDLTAELRSMRESLEAVGDSADRLGADVQRQSRRMGDLLRRVDALDAQQAGAGSQVPTGQTGAAGAMTATAAAAETGPHPVDELATEIAEALATDDGRAAISAAARKVLAERASRQQDVFIRYSLNRFAEEASLSETQARDLRGVWDDVMADTRKLMRDRAPTAGMTANERAERIERISTGMRDLLVRRKERTRAILDNVQYALYEKRQDEIDAGLHGAPPAPPPLADGDDATRR